MPKHTIGEIIKNLAKRRKKKKRSFDRAGTNVKVGAVLGIADGIKSNKSRDKTKESVSRKPRTFKASELFGSTDSSELKRAGKASVSLSKEQRDREKRRRSKVKKRKAEPDLMSKFRAIRKKFR